MLSRWKYLRTQSVRKQGGPRPSTPTILARRGIQEGLGLT